MTPLIENFRHCASMWFDGELDAAESRQFTNALYGYLRHLDVETDEQPLDADAWDEYRSVSRIWNSLAIENKRLAAEARDRVGPFHRPDCQGISSWGAAGRDGILLGCCQCDHEVILQFRVRGPDGELLDGCTVEMRTHRGNRDV